MPDATPRKGTRSGSDPLETAATIVSALLVLAIVAFLAREAVRGEPPAAFEVRLGEPRAAAGAGAAHLPVTVRNTGGRSAADVRIVVESGAGEPAGELTLDWLPAHSTRTGWLVLREAPRAPLTARVESYRPP
jgi:uncharacterized protein (TIGR02588 family)